MVIATFSMEDKEERFWFFKKTFLLANFSMDIALEILLLTLCNVEVNFGNQNLS